MTTAVTRLVNLVCSSQVSFEDIGAREHLFEGASDTGTKGADHRTAVVRQGMPILVVLARKSLCMVFACYDRALLGSFLLVREHV